MKSDSYNSAMRVLLVSGHKKNWDAGASTVYLHLERDLRAEAAAPGSVKCLHAQDYVSDQFPGIVQKWAAAMFLKRRVLEETDCADVVEVAGNLGWLLFKAVRNQSNGRRPLLVTRLHGLEFKDEEARVAEEIAGRKSLPLKYKLFTRRWLNWQEMQTIREADLVICHTSREVDAIVGAGLKPESQVVMMPLGVDEDFFLPDRDYRPAADRLLWWGSWVERKGIYSLPRAFDLACRRLPNLTLTLGGTGTNAETILSQFAPHLRSRIDVLPFVSREGHLAALKNHDVFLFPSLSEGFGLALLEAMAAGLPCITTFTGMAHDLLEHHANCLLAPMNGPTALARHIVQLYHRPELRRRLGTHARRTARALTWPELARQTDAAYRTHLSRLRVATVVNRPAPAIVTRSEAIEFNPVVSDFREAELQQAGV